MAASVAALIAPASAGPVVIERGRTIYDTALRYRDERRMSRSCEEDPAFDYVLTLFVERGAAAPGRDGPHRPPDQPARVVTE